MLTTDNAEAKRAFPSLGSIVRGAVVFALLVAVGAALHVRNQKRSAKPASPRIMVPAAERPAAEEATQPPAAEGLPKLVDLGAGKCIPCKLMAPILEELKTEYTGRLEVVFIDVWENQDAGQEYGISLIPTQVFYDPAGKELARHEGFFSKEDILAKWKELGFDLAATPAAPKPEKEQG